MDKHEDPKNEQPFPIELAVMAFAMMIFMLVFIYSVVVEDDFATRFVDNTMCGIAENNDGIKKEVVEFCEQRKGEKGQ